MTTSLASLSAAFLSRPGLAQSTLRSYESVLIPLLSAYGRWPIDLMSREVLGTYLDSLSHLAPATHHRHQSVLRALFNFAVNAGQLRANPMTRMRPRTRDASKTGRHLDPEQLAVLYRAVQPDLRLHALVNFLHRTGVRTSEVLALDLTDLDHQECHCQVNSRGIQRLLFWSDETADLLKSYIQYGRHPETAALFTAKQWIGGQVSRLSYRAAHASWAAAIAPYPELAGARLHDLQSTFAFERVGLMETVQLKALLGHTYNHEFPRYISTASQDLKIAARKSLKHLLKYS